MKVRQTQGSPQDRTGLLVIRLEFVVGKYKYLNWPQCILKQQSHSCYLCPLYHKTTALDLRILELTQASLHEIKSLLPMRYKALLVFVFFYL